MCLLAGFKCSPEGNENDSTCQVELLEDCWKTGSENLKERSKYIFKSQMTKNRTCTSGRGPNKQ